MAVQMPPSQILRNSAVNWYQSYQRTEGDNETSDQLDNGLWNGVTQKKRGVFWGKRRAAKGKPHKAKAKCVHGIESVKKDGAWSSGLTPEAMLLQGRVVHKQRSWVGRDLDGVEKSFAVLLWDDY